MNIQLEQMLLLVFIEVAIASKNTEYPAINLVIHIYKSREKITLVQKLNKNTHTRARARARARACVCVCASKYRFWIYTYSLMSHTLEKIFCIIAYIYACMRICVC